MILSGLVWLLLMLPGYALLRMSIRGELRCGVLGISAVSYVGTFALLSPVMIAGYVWQWPLVVLSAALVVAVVGAIVLIVVRQWWRGLRTVLMGGVCLEMGLLLFDLVLGARVGPTYGGDSVVHLMHIRALWQDGLSNMHPAYAFEAFAPIYHTNALYALVAAIAQITHVDPLDVWWSTLLWAKLVTVGGSYYLAWRIYERQWPAWAVALFVGGLLAPATFVLYPNKLAPLWLIPIALGQVVWIASRNGGGREVLLLAATTLVVAQIHSMYAFFLGLAAGPFLIGVLIWRALRGPRRYAPVFAAIGALWIPAPFLLASYLATYAQGREPLVSLADAGVQETSDRLLQIGERFVMVMPAGFYELALVFGLFFALRGPQRQRVGLFFLLILCGVSWWFNPLQCTFLLRFLGAPWMLLRMPFVGLGFYVLAIGGYIYWLEQQLASAAARGADEPVGVMATIKGNSETVHGV